MTLQSQMSAASPILLIEDEPSVTAFLRAALERRGYAVVEKFHAAVRRVVRQTNPRRPGIEPA